MAKFTFGQLGTGTGSAKGKARKVVTHVKCIVCGDVKESRMAACPSCRAKKGQEASASITQAQADIKAHADTLKAAVEGNDVGTLKAYVDGLHGLIARLGKNPAINGKAYERVGVGDKRAAKTRNVRSGSARGSARKPRSKKAAADTAGM